MNASVEPAPFAPYVGEDLARYRIEVTTVGDLLLKGVDRWPDKPALVFPDSSQTYAELAARALHIARGLQALGIKPRDHVGILMPTSPELVETFFAIAMCGAVAVMINARYRSGELAYVIENADLATIVTTESIAEHVNFVERLNAALPELTAQPDARALRIAAAPRLRNIALFGSHEVPGFVSQRTFDALAQDVPELNVHRSRVSVRVRDVFMMLYTSGTTANPKGCLLTHEAIVRNCTVLARHRFRFTEHDRLWSPLPLYHIAAMKPLLGILDLGGTFYGMQVFDAGLSLKMLQAHRITGVYLPFVTFLQAILYHPDFANTDLSSVRVMNSCFGVQPKSVGEGFRKAMPQTLQVGTYGMTESSGFVSTGTWDMDPELGFTRLGTPLVGQEVRIVDRETGEDLPAGQQGEVLVRGYNLFEGYYRDPAKSAEALDAQGWFHSGDVGSVDADGHLMFHGRTKDMLKVGGENVAAAEIETVLARHPAVKLAQIVGIPDEKYAEVPAAFVELKPGESATEAELIAYCRAEFASFKVPRLVRFVDEWPMSTSKIQKFQLRRRLLDELGRQG